MENISDKIPLIILGDFNGYIGTLGHYPLNYNKKIVLDFVVLGV